jgi:peptidoglycan/LPS O-acetylase OafA/YrhL
MESRTRTVFYLIVPFLIYFPRIAIAAALLSLSIFIASLTRHLSFEAFAYRTLPGTLFIFVVGMSFASRARHARIFPISVWLASAATVTVLYNFPEFGFPPYSKEVLVGLLVGIPVVAILKGYRSTQLDELLGNLSYGIFSTMFSSLMSCTGCWDLGLAHPGSCSFSLMFPCLLPTQRIVSSNSRFSN